MAAIRMKDRSGPGIVTEAVVAEPLADLSVEPASADMAAQTPELKRTANTRRGRGDFIGRNPLFEIFSQIGRREELLDYPGTFGGPSGKQL
jgi:hypothetical protein